LQPDTFRTHRPDEEYRDALMKELRDEAPEADKTPLEQLITPGYSIVIEKNLSISNIYLLSDGKKINKFLPGLPPELRNLTDYSYYSHYGRQRELAINIQRLGNKYPFIFKSKDQETVITFSQADKYIACTEFDARSDSVRISKVCFANGKTLSGSAISGDFIFDSEAKTFSLIQDKKGWRIWNKTVNLLYETAHSGDLPDDTNTSFPMPKQLFNTIQIAYPSGEGDNPLDLLLKSDGQEAQVRKTIPKYRLTATPGPGEETYTITAECSIESVAYSPDHNVFGFFPLVENSLRAPLRAQKRKKVLYQTFFDMLSADSKTAAEKIIKQSLTVADFRKFSIKREARAFLQDHLTLFMKNESWLILHDSGWISFCIDTKKELLLYKIPCGLFGCEVFRDTMQHDRMTLPAATLFGKLPELYEQLKEHDLELFFDKKPVTASTWDFAFDAVRPSGIDWFEIRPEITCNGEALDESLWQHILAGKGVIDKGDHIQVVDANAHRLMKMISDIYRPSDKEKEQTREIVQIPRLRILDWIMLRSSGVRVRLSPEDEEIISRLISFEKITAKPLPAGLKAKLRQYQKDGYSWLAFLYEHRFGACLADDMGLGKTVQAITLLAGIKEGIACYPSGKNPCPHLIVLPPSLLFNWESEINRFYPGLKTIFYTGKERSTDFSGYDIVLTTYGLVRIDIDILKEIQFDVIIFDEAQAIKNIYADTTGAVRQLKAYFKLAMTGTPVENHIGEYYSIVDLAVPGLLGDFEDFKPLIRQEVSPVLDMIIRRTRPFVLRRTKEKVLKELPEKIETDIYLELTEKQKVLYKKTVEQVRQTIDDAYRTKTKAQAQIIALTAILRLRQLCVAPQLLAPDIKEQSPKTGFLIEQLDELLEENHSTLIFSQFTSFLDLLEHDLKKHGITYLRLDGSTPVVKRKKLISQFQDSAGPSVFLLSLKAGGQGLNLTKASYVFHLDPWWNPAVENQASDRAHRIGQKKKVTITRILMRHTIEEKMMELKKKKLALYKAVMEDASGTRKGLSIKKEDFNFLLT
jgi:non-specific serine/threonine protein kinase